LWNYVHFGGQRSPKGSGSVANGGRLKRAEFFPGETERPIQGLN
jgi:hypothetical protein